MIEFSETTAATLKLFAAAIAIAIGAMFPARSIGEIAGKSAGKLQGPMLLALAFAEAVAIYAFVIAILIWVS